MGAAETIRDSTAAAHFICSKRLPGGAQLTFTPASGSTVSVWGLVFGLGGDIDGQEGVTALNQVTVEVARQKDSTGTVVFPQTAGTRKFQPGDRFTVGGEEFGIVRWESSTGESVDKTAIFTFECQRRDAGNLGHN